MELIRAAKGSRKKHIPVMGVEFNDNSTTSPYNELSGELDHTRFYRTAECAYYKAEARGFESGYEMEDWLTAETEVLEGEMCQ